MLECVNIENIDLGKRPMKIGGFKTYETRDDEVIVEAPILWGSDCDVNYFLFKIKIIYLNNRLEYQRQ